MKMIIVIECPRCHGTNELEVDEQDYEDYLDGGYVQECFPYLGPADRELLISGICPSCWAEMFSDEEEGMEEDGDF